jgi:hypothetical protein
MMHVQLSLGVRCLALHSLARPLVMLPCVRHHPVHGVSPQPSQQHLRNAFYRSYSSKLQDLPPIVTFEEVVKVLEDSSAVVIDVRQPEELERDGAIPGALHIPLGDLEVGWNSLICKFFNTLFCF